MEGNGRGRGCWGAGAADVPVVVGLGLGLGEGGAVRGAVKDVRRHGRRRDACDRVGGE